MNIITGERRRVRAGRWAGRALWLLAAWGLGMAAGAEPPAGDAPVWRQDFESALPGQLPRGWSRHWGQAGDDLMLVTNLHAAQGKQCLLIDRSTGTNPEMWGGATEFPDPPGAWRELSFCFMIEGRGDDARFGIDLRGRRTNTERILSWGFGANRVSLSACKPPAGADKVKSPSAEYRPGVWYRVRVWLSAAKPAKGEAWAMLEEREGADGWRTVYPPVCLPITPPRQEWGILMVNVGPQHRGLNVYLDAVLVRPAAGPPAE